MNAIQSLHQEIAHLQRIEAQLEHLNSELQSEIAKRRQVEQDLAREQDLLRTLMDRLPDLIFVKDVSGQFITVNTAVVRLLGAKSLDEIIGKTVDDFLPHHLVIQYVADDENVIQTGWPLIDREEATIGPDGKELWLSTTKVPIRNAEGQITGLVGIGRDITNRKHAEVALREAKEVAESANRAKSDFLANMSHEIRTPMNAIIGMTELVLDTELTVPQRDYLKMVMDSCESLLAVINDILDFSKIEAGKLELRPAPFALRESLGDTMKSLSLRAHAKELELACRIAPNVPNALIGDRSRLRQIVVNLVGNAIKFSEQGEVVVDVECESNSDDPVELQFSVSDTGIGIPKDKCEAIFEAFEQIDASTTRRFEGTGLGLAISSRLVRMMDGKIWVESEVDRGSTFRFTACFGLADPDQTEIRSVRPEGLVGRRVLIVDDNATNRRILEEMLSNWRMQPASVAEARQAVPLLREAQRNGRAYELVLTDANMPAMDGFALAEQIKHDRELGSTVIMMLTSGGRSDDVARCEDLGIFAYLMKPVQQSELVDAIMTAFGAESPETQARFAVASEFGVCVRPLHILLAEDSLINQKLAVALLQKAGHTVTVAHNGQEAVSVAASRSFDLVLMDVQMPVMDGLEATGLIREREKRTGSHVAVVAMTAHAMEGDRERCLTAGMDDFISKPIRAAVLFEVIGRLFSAPVNATVQPSNESVQVDHVDPTAMLQTVQGDRALLGDIVDAFLTESVMLMDQLQEAAASSDFGAVRRVLHTIKGSMQTFGAATAYRLAEKLEALGEHHDQAGADELIKTLKHEMIQVRNDLITVTRSVQNPNN